MTTTTNVFAALKTRIESGVAGLRIHDKAPSAVNELPAGVLIPVSTDPILAMGGTLSTMTVRLTIYVASGSQQEASSRAQDYLSPTGATSVIAALVSDPTLGGNVDDAFVRTADAIQREAFQGMDTTVAEFTIEIWRS